MELITPGSRWYCGPKLLSDYRIHDKGSLLMRFFTYFCNHSAKYMEDFCKHNTNYCVYHKLHSNLVVKLNYQLLILGDTIQLTRLDVAASYAQPAQKRFKNVASRLVFTPCERFWNVIFGKFI